MVGAIISGITFLICALTMIAIGNSQIKSEDPVGFYTGQKPFNREQITDVKAWNKKHGLMWIIYGLIIVLTWVCGLFFSDSLWLLLVFAIGILGPMPLMITYHNSLLKRYFKSE